MTVRQRHSLVELPPLNSGFTPRRADPRVGVFTVDFYDFATPVTEPVERQFIARHRLIKKDPKAEVSEPVAPIVYYVDRGAPEPVRSALVEGASWWAEAFEAAGFKNAFKVEVLPDDADPMDLRYNVIQWVHRSTRGWSYGSSVIDPRTGEILKGRVTLDSLRARQDALIGAGLSTGEPPPGACAAGLGPGPEHLAGLDPTVEPAAMVLARIRQLSAHEVGHTLGLAHNFAASACGRASVMDYPAPLVKIRDGRHARPLRRLRHAASAPMTGWPSATPTRSSPPGPTSRRPSARSSARASPTACCSSPTSTPGPPARPTRWPTSGTTATTRSPRSATR